MKPKIWNEEEAKTADKDQLFFKLDQCPEHQDISVIVVDQKGNNISGGHLIAFYFDLQYLILSDQINPCVPLKKDITNTLLYIEVRDLIALKREEVILRFEDACVIPIKNNNEKVSTH